LSQFSAHASDGTAASDISVRALEIRVTEPELQAYLQRYPFASGPDEDLNRRGRAASLAGIALRPATPTISPTQLLLADSVLPAEHEAVARQLMTAIGISEAVQAIHADDFAWEANLVPRSAKNVLVMGCGDGIELIFLRAVLPNARLTAVDYYDSLLPGLKETVDVNLHVGDLSVLLPSLPRDFDLVYSNHTMEHLFDPDETITTLRSLLVPGGCLVSVFPMHGSPGSPWAGYARRVAAEKRTVHPPLHPIDFVSIDLGHPWKTNAGDVARTFAAAGFSSTELFQRQGHLSRALVRESGVYERERKRQMLLNLWLLAPTRWLIRHLFPARHTPNFIIRLWFALERRVPFGTNTVMNRYTDEVLVRAQVG
jgi:SAM-dependent methyltransferase